MWYSAAARWLSLVNNGQSVAHRDNKLLGPHLWRVEGPQEAPGRQVRSYNPTVAGNSLCWLSVYITGKACYNYR